MVMGGPVVLGPSHAGANTCTLEAEQTFAQLYVNTHTHTHHTHPGADHRLEAA